MIKVTDVEYARFRAPDLNKAEAFLIDFGLVRSEKTDTALYMRGTDPDHHITIVEQGDPEFVGVAFKVASESDLIAISQVEGVSYIEDIDEPGGGKRVRISDPNGFQIEVIHGIDKIDPLPVKNLFPRNFGSERNRFGEVIRLAPGPCPVKRLGHFVLFVEDYAKVAGFYCSHFGLLSSDVIYGDDEDNSIIAGFFRCDRGDVYVDHHTLFINSWDQNQFHHVGFEVEGIDAIQIGYQHLESKGYQHVWGVGRHVLGSQIFDSWSDPWGRMHEHWTDGDLLNAGHLTGKVPVARLLDVQWGVPAQR
jgi:catechol 2,3-dioxygenase-like lactoylglutathione lyase family enzyme